MPTPRFQLVPAAYVYLRRGGEVLLQLRAGTGYMDGHWAAAAAGHVEAGESVVEAAIREVAEELGVVVAEGDLTPLTSLHRTDGTADPIEQRVDWMFAATRWDGEPVALEQAKNDGIAWFSLDALPLMPPHERYVLERWRLGTLRGIETHGFQLH
ncbi:MAG TPA: NUDIX domain-containing protein [Actinomycetaceae bacterium]|nr:NUDIX domain-containing protein [Actinomycetaceae bacterium]